jgi:hypothetical protein
MTAETAVTPTEEMDEIVQTPSGKVTIGTSEYEVRRIRTREVFTIMRILTGSNMMGEVVEALGDSDEDPDNAAKRLVAGLMVAIPYAEDDFLKLIQRLVVVPAEDLKDVAEQLANPTIELTMEILKVIVYQEAGELVRLGKDARIWWETMGPRIRERMSDGD